MEEIVRRERRKGKQRREEKQRRKKEKMGNAQRTKKSNHLAGRRFCIRDWDKTKSH